MVLYFQGYLKLTSNSQEVYVLQTKETEQGVLPLMIAIYCRKKHKAKELCEDCSGLLAYAKQRAEKCPMGENKTFCSNCKIHCYRPLERKKIQEVMRFSGKWMLFYHPILAISHVAETIKYKRKD